MTAIEQAATLGAEHGTRDGEAWAASTCTAIEAWLGRNPRPPEPDLSGDPADPAGIRSFRVDHLVRDCGVSLPGGGADDPNNLAHVVEVYKAAYRQAVEDVVRAECGEVTK